MKKVAMFVTNPCTHDARVIKEAETLAEDGYSVRIYALVKSKADAGKYCQSGYSIERLYIDGLLSRFSSWLRSVFRSNADVIEFESAKGSESRSPDSIVTSTLGNGARTTDASFGSLAKRLRKNRLGRLAINSLSPARKFLIYYFFCSDSAKSASAWGVQIAHCHDLSTLYAGKILKKKSVDLKVVYDSHELWVHRNRVGRKAWLEQKIDALAERHLIRFADRVVTVCDSIGEWLSSTYPDITAPTIIRNMPHSVTKWTEGDQTIKQRLNIPDENFVIVYTGKITSGRGIELGVRALKSESRLCLVLLGYGDESYVNSLKNEIRDLDVVEQVIFCDAVEHDKVASFIQGADLALVCIEPVCLSYEYALPNKLFESIQARVPVLGSSLIEIKNIVEVYDIGVCFQSESDMVSKIKSLKNDQLDEWRANMDACKELLSWEHEKNKLLDLYNKYL